MGTITRRSGRRPGPFQFPLGVDTGRKAPDGTVAADPVILILPAVDQLPTIAQAQEPVLVQALSSEQAVKTSDYGHRTGALIGNSLRSAQPLEPCTDPE